MAVKIRLQRQGRKARPFYHIVAADSRAPRDGRFIEKLGTYNPLTVPATIELNHERALHWLQQGAQPTDTTHAILKYKGVLYHKHLLRGVKKGVFTQEKADSLIQEWMSKKTKAVEAKVQETRQAMESRRVRIFGEIPKKTAPAVNEKPAETTEENAGE